MASIVRSVMGNIYGRKADSPNNEAAEERGQKRRGESVQPGQLLRSGNRSGAYELRFHEAHPSTDSSPAVVYLKTPVLRQCTMPAGLPNRREPH